MRRSNTQKLGEVIKDYLKESNIDKKLTEIQLIDSWEEIVGKEIARRTEKIYIRNEKLFVRFTSSVVRNEMLLHRETIRNRLNEKAGEELIKEIVLK